MRLILLIILFLNTFLFASIKEVTIAYNIGNPPLKFQNEFGQADGILIDTWKLWSKKTGIKINFKEATFKQTVQMIKDGEADIHAGLFYTKDRDKFLDYSDRPIVDISYHIFHHNDISHINNLKELEPYIIGVPEGFTHKFIKKHLPNSTLKVYKNFPELYKSAYKGEIKTFISPVMNYEYFLLKNNLQNQYHYSSKDILYNRTYFSAVKQDNHELLKVLNDGLSKITNKEIIDIQRKWIKSPINKNGSKETYIISCDSDYAPLTMLNEQGKPSGFYIDLWKLWAKKQNVEVKFLFNTWGKSIQAVKDGLADFHSGLEGAKKWQLLSKPFYQLKANVYYKVNGKSKRIDDFYNKTIGSIDPYYLEVLKKYHPKLKTLLLVDYADMFSKLKSKEIDGFMDDELAIKELLLKQGKQGEYVNVDDYSYISKISSATTKGNDTLINFINSGLSKISSKEYLRIEKRWITDGYFNSKLITKSMKNYNKKIILSNDEKKWLASNPMIKLAFMDFWVTDNNGNNIHSDLLKLLGKYSNLDIVPIKFNRWKDGFNEASSGKNIHGIMSLSWSKQREKNNFFYTKPYDYVPCNLITRKDNNNIKSLKDLENKTVYLKEKTITRETIRDTLLDIKIIYLKNDDEMIKKLSASNKKAQALLTYAPNEEKLDKYNLKIAKQIYDKYGELSIGVSHQHKHLHSIINKIYEIIPKEEILKLQNKTYESKKEKINISLTPNEQMWLKNHSTITVGADQNWPPFDFANKEKVHQGIASDYMKIMGNILGINFIVVPDVWKKVIGDVKEKKLDMLACAGITEDRKSYLNFSKPYVQIDTVVVTRSDDNRIVKMEDLYGKYVALPKNNFVHDQLKKAYPQIKYYFAKSNEEAIQAVSLGKADAYVGNMAVAGHFIQKHLLSNLNIVFKTPFKKTQLTLAVRKDWPELVSIFNKVLNNIPYERKNAILAKWLPSISYKSLTEPLKGLTSNEKAWLRKHKKIRVSNEKDWAPFNFIKDGKASGFSIDYFKLLSKKMGIEAEFIQGPTWNGFLTKIKNKEHDVMLNIRVTPDREKYLLFTKPYTDYITGFMVRDDFKGSITPKNIEKLKIAVVNNFSYHEVLKKSYPNIEFIVKSNSLDTLKAVFFGEADAAPGSIGVMKYLQKTNLIKGLKTIPGSNIKGVNDKNLKLHLGVRDDWVIFRDILNKAISNVNENEVQSIREKWFGTVSKNKFNLNLSKEANEWIKSNPMIKIAFMNYWTTDDKGNNVHSDLIKLLNKYSNLNIVAAKYDTWKDGFNEAIKGDNIHGIMNLSWSRERSEKYFDYSKAYNFIPNYLIVKKDNRDIKSLADLKDRTVYLKAKEIGHKTIENLSFNVNVIDLKDDKEMMEKLSSSDEADAYLSYTADTLTLEKYNLKVAKIIYDRYGEVSIGVSHKHKPLQSILDAIFNVIPKDELTKLRNKSYKKSKKDFTIKLGKDEKEWIQRNNNKITMCIDPNWMPFSKLDENGKFIGIGSEYINLFKKRLGYPIELIKTENWNESLEKIKNKDCDILPLAMKTQTRDKYLNFTSAYIKSPLVIATQKDKLYIDNIDDILNKKLGIVKGNAYIDIVKKKYPNVNIIEVQSVNDGLEKVTRGEIYGFIDSIATIAYDIQKNNLIDLKISGTTGDNLALSVAVRKDLPQLLTIMQKVVDTIKNEEAKEINSKWMSIKFEHGFDYTLFWKIIFLVVIIIAIFVYWNRKLSKEIEKKLEAQKKLNITLDNLEKKTKRLNRAIEFGDKQTQSIIKMNDDLKEAKLEADLANQAKSKFLANMSHEIRTPINAISGMIYLAQKTDLNTVQQNYLNKAQNASASLLEIINEILDFSKIEAGKVELEIIEFNLDEVLIKLNDVIGIKVQEKKLELLIKQDPEIPKFLIGDSQRLGQILLNLASNAVKFTHKGEIIITLKLLEKDSDNATLMFCIKDTGIGMTEEQKNNLFQEFTQADSSTTRKFGGTGLGLTISKKLVDLMGGKIWIDQYEINKGSTFCFTIDVQISKNKEIDYQNKLKQRELVFNNLKILIVDDNEASREIIQEMLITLNNSILIEEVTNGLEAISLLESTNDTEPFDIVIMDWKMPQLNGIETSIKIKENSKITKQPKIVMVTAYDRDELLKEAKRINIDGFLVKPVSPSTLFNALIQIESQDNNFIENIIKNVEELSLDIISGAKLLLVEDNEINQEFAVELLKSKGLVIEVADNGKIAVDMVQSNSYDAVLMDIQMPVMDGYEATKKIRDLSIDTPIISMTANAMQSDKDKAIQVGMNDYISKPIDPNLLFATLLKWIKPTNNEPIIHDKQDIEDIDFSALKGIDIHSALNRLSNNKKSYMKILLKFEEKYKNIVNDIKKLLEDKNIKEAEAKCHEIKGVSGNISANKLFKLLEELDNILKTDEIPSATVLENCDKELKIVLSSIVVFKESQNSVQVLSQQFDKDKVVELLKNLEESLENDISYADELLEQLEPMFIQSDKKEKFDDLSNKISNFDMDEANVVIKDLLNSIE